MATLSFNRYLKIRITFFRNTDTGYKAVNNTLNLYRQNCSAFIDYTVKVNTSGFKKFSNRSGSGMFRSNNLLIVSKAKVNVAHRLISVSNQGFDSIHNTDEMVFHIHCSPAPDISVVNITAERLMLPILLCAFGNRNNILVGQ